MKGCQKTSSLDLATSPKSTSLAFNVTATVRNSLNALKSEQTNVYVDDIIFESTDQSMVNEFEEVMQKKFKMSSMGTIKFFLGAKVDRTLYRAIIGALMYLTASRPDIMFAVFLCAPYQANPNVHHMLVVKKIMHYLKETPSLGLWYPCENDFELTTYSDSDYGGCKKNFKSTYGGCQFLGSRLVTWQCKKQTAVAQSTCEAEYIAAASCTSQVVIWIQQ
ncbi:secreted RxLR effector protein 161-like [Rutidosis leptorrhynchoides]|uniref:secreted RxLR effector protein 161-like n=1 Tax=Rutidosis leptorrhynchoides TaxID=125765 RepID=UPI003A999B8C